MRLCANGTVFRKASETVNPGSASPRASRRSRRWTGLKPRLRNAAALVGTGTRTSPCTGPGGGVEGSSQRPGQLGAQPGLPMAFEGQQALRQLGPVGPGRHHRQQHGPVHVHQGRRLGLGPERPQGQQAELPGACAAECQVLRPAAGAVHRNGQGEHLCHGIGRQLAQSRQRPRVAAAVSYRCCRGRGKVRIRGRPRPAGVLIRVAGHPPILDRVRPDVAGGRLCGQAAGRNKSPVPRHQPGRSAAPPIAPPETGPPPSCGGAWSSPGNDGSMGPLSCGDQPLPSLWKIPSADWP